MVLVYFIMQMDQNMKVIEKEILKMVINSIISFLN